MRRLNFSLLDGRWAIVQLPPESSAPAWLGLAHSFVSITRTSEELSVVCPESVVPADVKAQPNWRVLKLHGPFAFDEVGVLASFAAPLAAAGISLFAVSTFNTDYVLVKSDALPAALAVLRGAGHVLES